MTHLVVLAHEQHVGVVPFTSMEDAKQFYEQVRVNWSDVYLCEIISGPRDMVTKLVGRLP